VVPISNLKQICYQNRLWECSLHLLTLGDANQNEIDKIFREMINAKLDVTALEGQIYSDQLQFYPKAVIIQEYIETEQSAMLAKFDFASVFALC